MNASTGSVENEMFLSGTEVDVTSQDLAIRIETRDLDAGLYTLTMLADDLAGNNARSAVTFAVDRLPLIQGAYCRSCANSGRDAQHCTSR